MAHTFQSQHSGDRQRRMVLGEFKATLGYTKLIQSNREKEPGGCVVAHTFNPVLGSYTPLIPTLGGWRQEGYDWAERNIRPEETGLPCPIQPEDSVAIRSLAVGSFTSLLYQDPPQCLILDLCS